MTLHTAAPIRRHLNRRRRKRPNLPRILRRLKRRRPLATRLRPYRRPIVIGLAILLAWAVITQSLVAYLSDTSPEVAYWLHATPTVLLNLADDKLNADAATKVVEPVLSSNFEHASRERSYAKGIQSIEKLDAQTRSRKSAENERCTRQSSSTADNLSEADYAQIKTWAEQALRQDPLNARALRILAQAGGTRFRRRSHRGSHARRRATLATRKPRDFLDDATKLSRPRLR